MSDMLRADYSPAYFRRFLWVALGCLAYSGWCCYDALVAYPKKGVIAAAHDQLRVEFEKAEQDVSGLPEAWRAVAKQKGWPLERPEKTAEEVASDIGKQYMMIIMCAIVGLPALWKWNSGRGTWIEGDEQMLRNNKGQELKIAEITKIDKRKWEDKGIATIHYSPDGKGKKKFLMDDFKFDREPMGKLMRFAEANLKPDQINGKSEVQLEKEKEEAEAKKQKRRKERLEAAAKEKEAEAEAANKGKGKDKDKGKDKAAPEKEAS